MKSTSEVESLDGSVVCIVRPYNDETGEFGGLEEEIIHRRRQKIVSPTAPPIEEENGGGEKQKKYESKDLLSGFKTYDDQLEEVSIPATRTRSAKLKSSPKPNKKRPPITLQQDSMPCSIQNNNIQVSQLRSPESQRSTIDNSIMLKAVTQTSPQQDVVNKNGSRLCLLGTLRTFVVVWASLTLLSGSVSAFSSKHPNIFEYILASPLLWLVRFYMAMFHLVLILVELNAEVPLFVPKRTLSSFIHKGYLISFFGLLDSCLSSNISMEDIIEIWSLKSSNDGGFRPAASGYELKGVSGWKFFSSRSILHNICRVVLSVSSKGLIICGLLYCAVGLLGWTGDSIEQGTNRLSVNDGDMKQHPKNRTRVIRRGSLPGDPIIRYET